MIVHKKKYWLGFSGSLAGTGVGVRAALSPPSPGVPSFFFSSSFALLGLQTTNETTPSVFFNSAAAWSKNKNIQ